MGPPQKRSAEEAESLLAGVKALIVDIEGTTTPISFVKGTLFSYVKDNVDTYLKGHYDDADTQKDIAALRSLAAKDKEASVDGVVEIPDGAASKDEVVKAVADNIRWQMSSDRKSVELKQFQAHMWAEGYQLGAIKGDPESLYEDVAPVLQQLCDEGIKLYVFSSGSVEAQKLLFSNSPEGDITDMFTDYFDVTIGSKTDSATYKKITKEVGCSAEEILYLTDLVEEAKAAAGAGLQVTLVIRDGNAEISEEHLKNYSTIKDFNELYGDFDDDDLKRFEGDNGEADDDEEEEEDDEEGDDDDNPDDDEDV